MTVFLRILQADADDKAEALREAIHDPTESTAFTRDPAVFSEVPGSPFAYWVSDAVRSTFSRFNLFELDGRTVKQGLATTDDFRFLRIWPEVPQSDADGRWFGFAKGGSFSPFYADVHLALDWWRHGRQSWAIYDARKDVVGGIIKNPSFYFRPGLTYPARPHHAGWFSTIPAGCIFGHTGPMLFVQADTMLGWLGLLNSMVFHYLVQIQMARGQGTSGQTLKYEVGMIQQTPIPEMTDGDREAMARLARRAWSLKRSLDTVNETSHAFVLPPGLNERVTGLNPAAIERELAEIQREIDDRAFALYGIGPEDRAAIEASMARPQAGSGRMQQGKERRGEMVSWLVGVAFGRFDLRLATGEREIPPEPEPFDPLPARSPGMWPGPSLDSRFRGNDVPGVLVGRNDVPDILVDDIGHKDDLVAAVTGLATTIAQGQEQPSILARESLRPYLAKDFFPFHIKMYSKSRRKAPIYWQLATPSASYSVWLYYHRFTKDTLYKVVNDYIAPKLAHEERKLSNLTQEAGPNPAASQRKEIAAQQDFVDELRAFRDEVARVAPLWNPNLDDGVILNFAPLWRLVPQHKSWQKECKACWDKLCAGDYDWSHLAMHLWPERVVPKCAEDRSLAIAHGLEDTFWQQDPKAKWHPRTPQGDPSTSGSLRSPSAQGARVEKLIADRTSTAVKSALESLQTAPTPTKTKTRVRKKPTRNPAARTPRTKTRA